MITVADLDQAVGALLRHWSRFEHALNESLIELGQANPPHGLKVRLELWQSILMQRVDANAPQAGLIDQVVARLNLVLDVRNRLCHGMVAHRGCYPARRAEDVNSDPQEAVIQTRLKGIERTISLNEMQVCSAFLNLAAVSVVSDLTGAVLGFPLSGEWARGKVWYQVDQAIVCSQASPTPR